MAHQPSLDVYTDHESMKARAFREISHRVREASAVALREPLTEEFLARELAMSRTPVREALKRIEASGAIRPTARGYVLVRPTPRDVSAEYGVRALLEPHGAALAAANPLADLPRDAIDGLNFHLLVGRCAGNVVLARSLEEVIARSVTRALRLVSSPEEEAELRTGHAAVADAIAAGKPGEASAAMSSHLIVAREFALAALRRNECSGG
jgi:DNA-binding GntR family transcriptional regulator